MRSFVYIAGPYRARSGGYDASVYDEIEANVQTARHAAIFLAENGIPYFCPHLNSAHMEIDAPSVPPEFWIDLNMRILQYASAIYLLPRWNESRGTVAEFRAGRELGIRVFGPSKREDLVHWWKDKEKGNALYNNS